MYAKLTEHIYNYIDHNNECEIGQNEESDSFEHREK